MREQIGSPLSPYERELDDRGVVEAHQTLGEEAFSVARANGRAMTRERAIACALEETVR